MREIKFRIWNPEEKKMVESGATPMMLHSFFEYTARFHTQFEMPYQQFTGLLDKLGTDIYEGDLLASTLINPQIIECYCADNIIGSAGYAFKFRKLKNDDRCMYTWETTNLEVLGNIYNNKELLK